MKSPMHRSCSHSFIYGTRAWNKPTKAEVSEPPYRNKSELILLDGGSEANRLYDLHNKPKTKRRYRT